MMIQFRDSAIVFNDTLVSTRERPRPHHFEQKLHHFTQPDMLLASTGNDGVGREWRWFIEELQMESLEELHELAPKALRMIDDALTQAHGPLGISTIYHFGYPQKDDELVLYEYSSRDRYQGAKIRTDRVFVKPAQAQLNWEDPLTWQTESQIIAAAERIQAEQAALAPDAGQVLIGSDLLCAKITPGSVTIEPVHRFADYDQMTSMMDAAGARG